MASGLAIGSRSAKMSYQDLLAPGVDNNPVPESSDDFFVEEAFSRGVWLKFSKSPVLSTRLPKSKS